ncbi:hypothetical protein BKA70DRAFT_1311965 [Coprinopsis sp. MPI-PUGE-AT-0042]|nr:hypothetical protein BKA70DRAFT_1311965 [Coprinopsis sp. MPI-PUGE-AT-0042]
MLALCLWLRFSRLGSQDDLNEAISLERAVLPLTPPGHPDCATSLNNLGPQEINETSSAEQCRAGRCSATSSSALQNASRVATCDPATMLWAIVARWSSSPRR